MARPYALMMCRRTMNSCVEVERWSFETAEAAAKELAQFKGANGHFLRYDCDKKLSAEISAEFARLRAEATH